MGMDKYENYDLTDGQWKRIEPLLPPGIYREERTPTERQPDDAERYAVDESQWSTMETASRALRPLAKRLCPFRQVAEGWRLGEYLYRTESGCRH